LARKPYGSWSPFNRQQRMGKKGNGAHSGGLGVRLDNGTFVNNGVLSGGHALVARPGADGSAVRATDTVVVGRRIGQQRAGIRGQQVDSRDDAFGLPIDSGSSASACSQSTFVEKTSTRHESPGRTRPSGRRFSWRCRRTTHWSVTLCSRAVSPQNAGWAASSQLSRNLSASPGRTDAGIQRPSGIGFAGSGLRREALRRIRYLHGSFLSAASRHMEHRFKRVLKRAPVRTCRHQLRHIRPPALHHVLVGKPVHRVIRRSLEQREQVMGLVVEKDPLVGDTRIAQNLRELCQIASCRAR